MFFLFLWNPTIDTEAKKEDIPLNVSVNENCIGCGLCTCTCGSVFLMLDEGVAAAKDEIYPEEEPLVEEAAESCPTHAIIITLEV